MVHATELSSEILNLDLLLNEKAEEVRQEPEIEEKNVGLGQKQLFYKVMKKQ